MYKTKYGMWGFFEMGSERIDDFIGSEFITDKSTKLTVVGVYGKSKTRIKLYNVSCDVCSLDKELFPELFKSTKGHLKSGRVPCGCSKIPKWSKEQIVVRTRRLCSDNGYYFVGYKDGYSDIHSKFEYLCPEHGLMIGEYNNFVNNGNSCPICASNTKLSTSDMKEKLSKLGISDGYKFLYFEDGEYKNQYSYFKYECTDHGVQRSMCCNFINSGSRCPSCASSGYDSSKPGWLYIFKYNDVYKFGITNRDIEKRSDEHIHGLTGIERSCIFKRLYENGSIPKNIESKLKKKYKGVCSWLTSGNTETIYNKDLKDLLQIIEGYNHKEK